VDIGWHSICPDLDLTNNFTCQQTLTNHSAE